MLKNGIVILCVMLGFMTKIAHAEIKTISELLSAGYESKTAIKGGFFARRDISSKGKFLVCLQNGANVC